MKFKPVVILIVAAFFHTAQETVAQIISLSEKNAPLQKVFQSIEKQTGFLFWYEYALLERAGRVTIHVNSIPLKQALDLCIQGKPLKYTIIENTIAISGSSNDSSGLPQPAPLEIRGQVKDSLGMLLDGVSVSVSGGHAGVVTDHQGYFRIAATPNSIVHFSLVSYQSQDLIVGSATSYAITMGVNRSVMNDVVVIGYGSLSQKNITGSISSVKAQALQNQHRASLDQAIGGQAAGVQVSQLTGTPGGGAIIRVRGTGSISAGNDPLYVIDGFPIEGSYDRDLNPLSMIDVNDISDIQILKDASAAAIYGSRGSNGVVLVTTKRGHTERPSVQFDTYYGIQQVAHTVDMLNASEYAAYNIEARNNAWTDLGGSSTDPDSVRPYRLRIPTMFKEPSSLGAGTDWQNQLFRAAPMQSYHVSLSNGKQGTHYLLSAGVFDQRGIVKNTGFKRYAVRFNLDSKLGDKIKIGFNLAPTYAKNEVLPVDDQIFGGGILGAALAMPPTVPVYNTDGSYATLLNPSPYNIGLINNPVAVANKLKEGSTAVRMLASFFAEWEMVKGLKLRSSAAGDYYDNQYNFYWPSDLGRGGSAAPVIPEGIATTARTGTWLIENTMSWIPSLRNGHFIDVVAGITAQKSKTESTALDAIYFPTDDITTLNSGEIIAGGTDVTEWSLRSQLARINYNYKSKYLLTATVRRDGSSRFGPDNKWATFPSASIGWNLSKEEFMNKIAWITDLKLRASYGYAGNNSIGDYSYVGAVNYDQYVFQVGAGSFADGLQPSRLGNPHLHWEVMKQTDIGADIGLFGSRAMITVDYFSKITSDLLLNVPIPGSLGFSTALQNIGKVSNKGWELALISNNLVNAFGWKTSLNISFNKNRVLELGPLDDPIIASSRSFNAQTHITMIGHSIANFYGYEVIGVYRDQADVDKSARVESLGGSRPGDLKFRDVNGDGRITPLDMTNIGHNDPDFIYGMTNEFSYRSFTLSIMIDGVQGAQVLNGARKNIELSTGSYSRRDVLGRWQSPQHPGDGKTPRANVAATGGTASFVSSLLVEDVSFLRMRNIVMRYDLTGKLFRLGHVPAASVFVSVDNAFMITRYKGYNPEQNLNGSDALTRGTEYNGYPLARVFGTGLSITFQ